MVDIRLKFSDEGVADVLRDAKAVAREVDKTSDTSRQRRMESFSRAQNKLARDARAERFRELSDNEKLARLTERRAQLERFLARAQAQGNQYRVGALKLALAQTANSSGFIGGTSRAAVAAEATRAAAEQQRRLEAQSKTQSSLARAARADRFRELSDTEKLGRLTERRIQLERFLARAQVQGNQYRVNALKISLAQTAAASSMIAKPGGFLSSFGANMGAGMGIFGGAALGAGVGSALGAGLAIAATSLVTALKNSALNAIRLADNLDDTAEQMGVGKADVLRMQEGATRAGLPSRFALRGIAQLGQMRGTALAGDEKANALFANYGVSPEMLSGSATNLELAERIRQSLGAGGMTPNDERNLQSLFGMQPRRTIAMLTELGKGESASSIEEDITLLAAVNNQVEKLWQKTMRVSLKAWSIAGALGYQALTGETLMPLPASAPSSNDFTGRTAGDFNIAAKAETTSSSTASLSALPGRSAADALTRIGLFAGGNPAEVTRRLDTQITELRKLTARLDAIYRVATSEW